MALIGFLIFLHTCTVCAEVDFWRAAEGQSVELSCPITEQSLSHLHLYLRGTHTQTTLLSLSQGAAPRVNHKYRGRLRLSGGLRTAQVDVTLLHSEQGDTGVYVWEMTEGNGSKHITSDQRLFLLIESTEKLCLCSAVYPPLLLTVSAAAGLLLIIIIWIGITHNVKLKQPKQPKHQPSPPIYVEMSWKDQAVAQDVPESPSHLEEAQFPVYANPNYRPPQDNYYACPRQAALKAS